MQDFFEQSETEDEGPDGERLPLSQRESENVNAPEFRRDAQAAQAFTSLVDSPPSNSPEHIYANTQRSEG